MWVLAGLRDRWNCSRCGTLLAIRKIRRLLAATLMFATAMLYALAVVELRIDSLWVIGVVPIVILCWQVDGVRVVE